MTNSSTQNISPARLALQIILYYVVIIVLLAIILELFPATIDYLPVGGMRPDLVLPGTAGDENIMTSPDGLRTQLRVAVALSFSLIGTVILMLPISWVYMASKHETGFERNFVIALIVLPICATTTVLLIQNSLALAFGLAALVASIRFRIDLDDALDGVHVVAAIAVGLASGVGYIGVATLMTFFFCLTIIVLWMTNYANNPVEEEKLRNKREKLFRQKTKS